MGGNQNAFKKWQKRDSIPRANQAPPTVGRPKISENPLNKQDDRGDKDWALCFKRKVLRPRKTRRNWPNVGRMLRLVKED